jgi:ABC-type amino acid transport substrate-binding protein
MTDLRWAAAATLVLTVLLTGCQPPKDESANQPRNMPSAEKVAAAKARYAARGEALVGVVDDTVPPLTAVSGIDAKDVNQGTVFHFIDVDTNTVVCQGTLNSVAASGRLIVDYDKTGGQRPPQAGDLCLVVKQQ